MVIESFKGTLWKYFVALTVVVWRSREAEDSVEKMGSQLKVKKTLE